MEAQEARAGKHTFKKHKVDTAAAKAKSSKGTASAGAGVRDAKLLSFGGDEDEQGGGDDGR